MAKFIVKTPSNSFEGKRAGIHFRNGEASFEDAGLKPVFESLGYSVIEVTEAKKEASKPESEKKAAKTSKKRGE